MGKASQVDRLYISYAYARNGGSQFALNYWEKNLDVILIMRKYLSRVSIKKLFYAHITPR